MHRLLEDLMPDINSRNGVKFQLFHPVIPYCLCIFAIE